MNIFERTRQKREQDAGTQSKTSSAPKKESTGTMSQADFSGYKDKPVQRPPMSKKWRE